MSRYIDADALRNKIQVEANALDITDDEQTDGFWHGLIWTRQALDDMPTADVGPVRYGRWVEDKYSYEHCSVCGFEWDEPEYVSNFRCTVNYCPNCGAKMDGGSER